MNEQGTHFARAAIGERRSMRRSAMKRVVSLDAIRVIAISSVISMHINEATLTGVARCAAVEFGSIGVPLFAMLTGYLMLDRDYSSRDSLVLYIKNNLIPMFCALEAWNIIWAVIGCITGSPIPLGQTLKVALFLGNFGGGFWYLPMVFGLYLGIPLFSHALKWLSSQNVRPYACIFGCALLYFGVVIPTVVELCFILGKPTAIKASLDFGMFGVNDELGRSLWPIYLILGYLIKQLKPKGAKPAVCSLLLFALSFVALVVMRSAAYESGVGFNPSNYANAILLVASVSLLVFFVSLEASFQHLPLFLKSTFQIISESSFGIYMIHFSILGQLLVVAPQLLGHGSISFFLLGGSILVISLAFVIVVSRVPVINRYVLLMKPKRT